MPTHTAKERKKRVKRVKTAKTNVKNKRTLFEAFKAGFKPSADRAGALVTARKRERLRLKRAGK